MAVTTSNLIMGPATLYSGVFGAQEPLDSQVNTTPAASAWADAGGTLGGLTMTINQTYTNLDVDQVVDVVGRRLTSRDIQVKTSLAEATVANLGAVLNGGIVVTGSGATPTTFEPNYANTSASQAPYAALIFDGWAPQQFRRRVLVRKVLSIDSVDVAYTTDGQTVLPVTFGAHYVSSTIAPFHIVDSNQ